MTSPVLFEELLIKNGQLIGFITLNSEKTLNALTLEMIDLMLEQLQQWNSNDKIAAVFIQGAGEKSFCAGGDVQALYHSSIEQPGGPCEYAESFFEREYRLDYLLHNYTKPTIAWGHGIVMGGGLGVFAGCSYRIATEKTRIAMPEVTIALFPDVGGSYFLNKMPGYCGRFLALTGASINATDSYYVNITNYTICHTSKNKVIEELLSLDCPAIDIDNKLTSIFSYHHSLSIADIPEGNLQTHQALINDLCRWNDIEKIAAKFSELNTDEKWLQRAKKGIATGSPLAIKWIFHQLTLCENLELKAVFQHEILLATTIVRHTEFAEGVRALLIDKDQTPNWQYKNLHDVTDDIIVPFFDAPWPQNPLTDL